MHSITNYASLSHTSDVDLDPAYAPYQRIYDAHSPLTPMSPHQSFQSQYSSPYFSAASFNQYTDFDSDLMSDEFEDYDTFESECHTETFSPSQYYLSDNTSSHRSFAIPIRVTQSTSPPLHRKLSSPEHLSILETHLTTRPTKNRLIKNNIIKFPNISPALIPQTEKLLWEHRKYELQIRMSKRPRREYLVSRLIIKESEGVELATPAQEATTANSTTSANNPLKKTASKSRLSGELLHKMDEFLKNRPRLKELVERKLIYSSRCEPFVTSIQRKMDQERRRCSLLDALNQRPSVDQMKQRGILLELSEISKDDV